MGGFAFDPNATPMMQLPTQFDQPTSLPPDRVPVVPQTRPPPAVGAGTTAPSTVAPLDAVPDQPPVMPGAAPSALTPTLPPSLTANVKPTPDEADDENVSMQKMRELEQNAFGQVGSHRGKHETIEPPDLPTMQGHKNFPILEAIKQKYGEATTDKGRKEIASIYERELKRMENEVRNEQKRIRSTYHQQQKDELSKIDNEGSSSLKAREEEVGSVEEYLKRQREARVQQQAGEDTQKQTLADYDLKVSPLGTMPDDQLSNVIRSVAVKNRLTISQATQYVLDFGTSATSDRPTVNGLTGKGGRYFKPHKSAINGDRMVEAGDGSIIRMSPRDYTALQAANEASWKAGKQWNAERKAKAAEKPLPERIYNWGVKQFQ